MKKVYNSIYINKKICNKNDKKHWMVNFSNKNILYLKKTIFCVFLFYTTLQWERVLLFGFLADPKVNYSIQCIAVDDNRH